MLTIGTRKRGSKQAKQTYYNITSFNSILFEKLYENEELIAEKEF